jgi:hypothetical protein
MPPRQLGLHHAVLEAFLNDLQFLIIRPMPAPGFGAGHNFYAGFEFAVAHKNNWYEIPNQPKRRPSPDAYQKGDGVAGPALVMPEARKIDGRAQFEQLGALLPGDVERRVQMPLCGLAIAIGFCHLAPAFKMCYADGKRCSGGGK